MFTILDVAFNKEFKRICNDYFDEHMAKHVDREEGFTASEKRVLITKWVGDAWQKMHPPPSRKCQAVEDAFVYTGSFR